MIKLYIDADACPVKNEVFRVARRYRLKVYLVSNSSMRIPPDEFVELIIVHGGFDAADDWIASHITETDIAVTADIPLAARCLKKAHGYLIPKGGYTARTLSAMHWQPGTLLHFCVTWAP